MFMPDHFRVEDVAEMHALMRAHPFAALVSMTPSGLYGTHLPTVLKNEDRTARSNAISRAPIRTGKISPKARRR